MGYTLARIFYIIKNRKKNISESERISNWTSSVNPYYYKEIPSYLSDIYNSIDVHLKHECKATIPEEIGIPYIFMLDELINDFKNYIANIDNIKYPEKYKEFDRKLKEKKLKATDSLILSDKYCVNYLHFPNEEQGDWFCEGIFTSTKDTEQHEVLQFVEEYTISLNEDMDQFMEGYIGSVFNLAAEYLIIKHKVPAIFYSCPKCYIPAIYIKNDNYKLKDNEQNDKMLWGTTNVADNLIFNFAKINGFFAKNNNELISMHNIIYHDESFSTRPESVNNDCAYFQRETEGAFILTISPDSFINAIEEIKRNDPKNKCKFDLIITGSTSEKIIKIIKENKYEKIINKVCIYTFSVEKYKPLKEKYNIISGIYDERNDLITNFILWEKQNGEIYNKIVKIISYEEYIERYSQLHKLISSYYSNTSNDSYSKAYAVLQDFIFWCPNLKVNTKEDDKTLNKTELLLNSLAKFKDINANEEDLIEKYTEEFGSFYQDFNKWLLSLDPLAYNKMAWFISGLMYSLESYSNKGKGVKKNEKLYRGIRMNYIDLLAYQKHIGRVITFPSFTSTSSLYDIAFGFSQRSDQLFDERKEKNFYSVIINIDYKYDTNLNPKLIPTAVDVSEIAHDHSENERLFLPFSFFKVNKVVIDDKKLIGDIYVESIGKVENIEENLKLGKSLFINSNGYLETR